MNTKQQESKTVGKIARELRKQRELSLEEVASKAKISVPYLSQIERGRSSPSEDVIRRLAVSLDVSVAYLMGEIRNNPPSVYPVLRRWFELFNNPSIPHDVRSSIESVLDRMADVVDYCFSTGREKSELDAEKAFQTYTAFSNKEGIGRHIDQEELADTSIEERDD